MDDDNFDITEEMIDAGVAALSMHDSDYESQRQAVIRIFAAMIDLCRDDYLNDVTHSIEPDDTPHISLPGRRT